MSIISDAQDHLVKQGFTRKQAEYLTRATEDHITFCEICKAPMRRTDRPGRPRRYCSTECSNTAFTRWKQATSTEGRQRHTRALVGDE